MCIRDRSMTDVSHTSITLMQAINFQKLNEIAILSQHWNYMCCLFSSVCILLQLLINYKSSVPLLFRYLWVTTRHWLLSTFLINKHVHHSWAYAVVHSLHYAVRDQPYNADVADLSNCCLTLLTVVFSTRLSKSVVAQFGLIYCPYCHKHLYDIGVFSFTHACSRWKTSMINGY